MFEILNTFITNINKELSYNSIIFKYIICSYFSFERIKGKNDIKYIYNYSFPILEDIYDDIMKFYNNKYFLDKLTKFPFYDYCKIKFVDILYFKYG